MYRFFTIKPGAVPASGGRLMAPHLALWVVARGINLGLHTRMYFPEDTRHHGEDLVLRTVELAVRRATLIGRLVSTHEAQPALVPAVHDLQSSAPPGGPHAAFARAPRYRFDIVLQGPNETVFFDV
jgi:protocatechuate 3,4-dioxygenase alpha subunit